MLKNRVVLVVDDNADNRILLTEMLFEWGMVPVVCASALEALRLVLGNRYEFALGLIDICMPGTTGSELAKQIKAERPLFPLIALSSLDSFSLNSDFEHKLDKPLNKVQLFNAIHNLLARKQAPSAFLGDAPCHASKTCSPSPNFNKNLRILIAEDVTYNSNLLTNMLSILGYLDVSVAKDGNEAIDLLSTARKAQDPFEILLLDLRMPNTDGYGVIAKHKEMGWTLPKIVVVTASVMEDDRRRCREEGVSYFINKPIEMNQLKEIMYYISDRLGYDQNPENDSEKS